MLCCAVLCRAAHLLAAPGLLLPAVCLCLPRLSSCLLRVNPLQFARIYTPIILAACILLAFLPWAWSDDRKVR